MVPVTEQELMGILAHDDFDDSLRFRADVVGSSDAAAALLRILRDQPRFKRNALAALGCFGREVFAPLTNAAATTRDAGYRRDLIRIAGGILSRQEPVPLGWLPDVATFVRSLLGDRSWIEHEFPENIEIDFYYRVCDDAYLLWQRIGAIAYDEGRLGYAALQERDAAARELETYLAAAYRPGTAPIG